MLLFLINLCPFVQPFISIFMYIYVFPGTVIRATTIKLLDCEKEFVCNQCRQTFTVEADFEQYYSVCRPSKCPNEADCSNVSNFTVLAEQGGDENYLCSTPPQV